MKGRRTILFSFPVVALLAIYFLGPQPKRPVFSLKIPAVPADPAALEKFVADNEAKHHVKPENEATIIWHDTTKRKTDYAVVYLHGFSASKMEGHPVHRQFASAFGCNLYLSRLSDHGVDTTETLLLFTADRAWESAKEALFIGKQLGEKVILLSTSTGGTLALKLAAEFPDDVYALINLSPNVEINNGAAFLLNNPWGLHIARMVMGGNYRITQTTDDHARFWNKKYRVEALTELQELVEETMKDETFKRVHQPCLTLYYYKDEEQQDPEVKVSAMLQMHENLGTPDELKEARAIPNAGAHVIGSALTSNDWQGVYRTIERFAEEKLRMRKISI